MLSEPDFHWEALVTDAHEAAGIPYWDKVADQRIITGWTSEPPPTMVNLADQLGVDEQAIARRCIQLKLSDSRLAVVERFGAVPGGSLETQARLARDNASVIVAVLAVAAREGQILHLSIHPTEESAISLLRSLDPDALTAAPTHWTVVPRIVGEGSVRIGLSGEWSDVSRLPQHPNT
ncbi:hypothetical protein [Nocardia sp. NPDC006630]|uniref:hypothetical protein n=1 Tax=Nocardia sp. NPDC006630 TaxID=3157181 RepID=UPI0033A41677